MANEKRGFVGSAATLAVMTGMERFEYMKNNTPYVVRIAQAITAGDNDAVRGVYQEAMGKISDDCEKLIRGYSHLDLPIVLATMEIVAEAAKSELDPGGLDLLNTLKDHTTCIRVDAGGFRRQMGDDDGK